MRTWNETLAMVKGDAMRLDEKLRRAATSFEGHMIYARREAAEAYNLQITPLAKGEPESARRKMIQDAHARAKAHARDAAEAAEVAVREITDAFA